MSLPLRGTERRTVEIDGRVPDAWARGVVPPNLELDSDGGKTVVNLLLFEMKGLRVRGLPPGMSYGEALWRIGVRSMGETAWLAIACHLDNALVRIVGRTLIRYPVCSAQLAFEGMPDDGRLSVQVHAAEGALAVKATATEIAPDAVPPRRLYVQHARGLYEIPWEETPAPWRRGAVVTVEGALAPATFPGVEWAPAGRLHQGRIHHCNVAVRR